MSIIRNTCLACLFIIPSHYVSAKSLFGDVKLTQLNSSISQVSWQPQEDKTPKYPLSLAKKGVSGCGIFKVVVNESGRTESVELLRSIPKQGLLKPSKKILKKTKWMNTSNSSAVSEEQLVRIDFCLGGSSIQQAKSICARQAQLACAI